MGPVFVLSPLGGEPQGLFESLCTASDTWTTPDGPVIERMPLLHPSNRGWDSDRLTGSDLTPEVTQRYGLRSIEAMRDADGKAPPEEKMGMRLIDMTPANMLRIRFLAGVFADAVFIYQHREPTECLAEMLRVWRSDQRITHPELPEWTGAPWSLPLTPEWRKLRGEPLPMVVAQQWKMAMRVMEADLERLPPERWSVVDREALIADPKTEIGRLAEFARLEWDGEVAPTLTKANDPAEEELAEARSHIPEISDVADRARKWIAGSGDDDGDEDDDEPLSSQQNAFRSVGTGNLGPILEQLNSSLLITTYQTGRLVIVRRTDDGINTHFRTYESPMGLARWQNKLAVGLRSQIYEFQNVPAVAAKIDPPGSHDACYVPRRTHYTGDIRIHEIGYVAGELWIVATRFSCLATLDADHSFVPKWRPKFISGYAAEDRCHLNGMAIVDDEVRYVSALGQTDEAGGWRENKASGGILIHVPSDEIVCEGLSMPHSPRWYRGQLWVLESGEGRLCTVDPYKGTTEVVAELPGFTRGIVFAGPLAFIGLSEVRESATFGGLPLTARLEERECGVWIVNIETGETVGFLRFEGNVEEIFAVELLPGVKFPEVAEHSSDATNLSFVLPDEALAEVQEPKLSGDVAREPGGSGCSEGEEAGGDYADEST